MREKWFSLCMCIRTFVETEKHTVAVRIHAAMRDLKPRQYSLKLHNNMEGVKEAIR